MKRGFDAAKQAKVESGFLDAALVGRGSPASRTFLSPRVTRTFEKQTSGAPLEKRKPVNATSYHLVDGLAVNEVKTRFGVFTCAVGGTFTYLFLLQNLYRYYLGKKIGITESVAGSCAVGSSPLGGA